jgi:hypothetical protein
MRQPVADYMHETTGLSTVEVVPRRSLPDDQLINVEILKGEKIAGMKNYVQIYSFEDICSDSINTQSKCVVGTKNPFKSQTNTR